MNPVARKRPQGRQPHRLPPTSWTILIRRTLRWEGDSLTGLHRWLIANQPQPADPVSIWRNDRLIYQGRWDGLVGDATLW